MVYKVTTGPQWVKERLEVIDRACVAAVRIQRHSPADSTSGDLTQRIIIPAVTKVFFQDMTSCSPEKKSVDISEGPATSNN